MNHSTHSSESTAIADYPRGWKQPTILFIDDDPEVSQSLVRYFSRYDATVLQAYHGAQGMWLATTRRPDVIVTDLRMPQGRGQDVVEYLKRRLDTCHIPIIVLTGLCDYHLERRLWKMGIDRYFTKPVRLEALCLAIGEYVELRQKEEYGLPVDES